MLYCGAGRAGAGRAGRARGACVLGVLGVQGARGRRACVGRVGVARRRHGRWSIGRHERRRAAGARQQLAGRAGRAGTAWARGWAHGARRARPAWAWPERWMGAQAGPAGPVLVHCAPGLVLARFLDPVRLGICLSHQMNTVHCKINFRNFFFY